MLYAASDLAYVGGSLEAFGGHNPLEPASVGKPILTGPDVSNFESIYSELIEQEAVIAIDNSMELSQAIIHLLDDKGSRISMGHKALQLSRRSRGPTDVLAMLVSRVLPPPLVSSLPD